MRKNSNAVILSLCLALTANADSGSMGNTTKADGSFVYSSTSPGAETASAVGVATNVTHSRPSITQTSWLDIGIDVGGTNTDAVLILRSSGPDALNVVKASKYITSDDVVSGIVGAVEQLFEEKDVKDRVVNVFVGTTQFVNAIVQRSSLLVKVDVVRISGMATTTIPPFFAMPDVFRKRVQGRYSYVDGGYDHEGKEYYPFRKDVLRQLHFTGEDAPANIVLVGMYSGSRPDQEDEAARLIANRFPGISITKSHDVGQHGLIARENAAIINESLRPLARRVVNGLKNAFKDKLGLGHSRLFLTENDGTLLPLEQALQFPVKTLNCGPTNSMRGAGVLCMIEGDDVLYHEDVFVCDIGGTTSDIGVLQKGGYPRLSNVSSKVGGIELNSRFPDTISIPLGGGTLVDPVSGKMGPASVGNKLAHEAMIFGGDKITLTDIAAVAGYINIDVPEHLLERLRNSVQKSRAEEIMQLFADRLAQAIYRLKTSNDPVTLILCGGGAALFSDDLSIPGVKQILRPPHADVANAVGAALAQVSVDMSANLDLGHMSRDAAREQFRMSLENACYEKGATRESVVIHSMTDMNLGYVSSDIRRFTGRAVGNIDFGRVDRLIDTAISDEPELHADNSSFASGADHIPNIHDEGDTFLDKIPEPRVSGDGIWSLTHDDIDLLAEGCSILGGGGGGKTTYAVLRLKRLLTEGREINIIAPSSLEEGARVIPVGFIGAPSVLEEVLGSGEEFNAVLSFTEEFYNQKPAAIMSIEMGGSNGLEPLYSATLRGLPCVDADGMGRAFPTVDQYLPLHLTDNRWCLVMAGIRSEATAICEDDLDALKDGLLSELMTKHSAIAALAMPPLTSEQVSHGAVLHTYSQAWRIGATLYNARLKKLNPVDALVKLMKGNKLVEGIIIDVQRDTGRFDKGHVTIRSDNDVAEVLFANENLAFIANGVPLATTPDLISIVDIETGRGIYVDELKIGLRVAVITAPSPAAYRGNTAAARLATPAALGRPDIPTVNLPEPREEGESICTHGSGL